MSYDLEADRFLLTTAIKTTEVFSVIVPDSGRYRLSETILPDGSSIFYEYSGTGFFDGRLLSAIRYEDGITTGLGYEYDSSNRLEFVTLYIKGQVARQVRFTYHEGLSEGDLRTVEESVVNGDGDLESLGTTYLRYYQSEEEDGFSHGLKFVLLPEASARLIATGSTFDLATDEELSSLADYHFTYDWARRVRTEAIRGGSQAFQFEYERNQNFDLSDSNSSSEDEPAVEEANSWLTKTTVTNPDNTQIVAYGSRFGQTIFHVFRSVQGEWCRYFRYDELGRVVLSASGDAIAGYDERFASLARLQPNSGRIKFSDFYVTTSSGGAPGKLRSIRIRKGTEGEDIVLQERQYVGRNQGSRPYYFVSIERRFLGQPGASVAADWSYEYTWHDSTALMESRTTTLPIVPTDQNGSGVADEFTEFFDIYQNRTSISQLSIVQQWTWDPAYPNPTQLIVDSGGANLVTDYSLDQLGRIVQELGPENTIDVGGVATSIRSAMWTEYLDASLEVRSSGGYIPVPIDSNSSVVINPVSITRMDRSQRVIEQIQQHDSTYCRLSKTYYDDQSHLVAQRVYHLIPSSGEGSEGTNYSETKFGYDDMARRIWTASPAGTITRSVLDTRGRQISTWLGTNDDGATPVDPTGGATPGNNMVQVEERQYDRGVAGGNDLLTSVIAKVSATESRVTSYEYDFRDFRTFTLGENGIRESYQVDLSGAVTMVERWNDDGSNPVLVARNETLYDPLGRVFRAIRYSVDPRTGEVGNSLADETWFDSFGRVVKQRNPEDAGFEKLKYDSVGRVTNRYAGYNSVTPSYAEAQTVEDDTIFSQTDNIWDAASNLIQVAVHERFHDTSGLGPLGGPSGSAPNSRVLYAMYYPDPLGRIVATANYGTNGGTPPTRSDILPLPSDTILVSTIEFNECGEAFRSTDPESTVTLQAFDNLGRLVKTTENYIPS